MTRFIAPDDCVNDGFLIRSYKPGDGPRLAKAVTDSYAHLAPFLPWAKPTQTPEASEELVRNFCARYLLSEDFALCVFDPTGNTQWGGTGFHLREGPLEDGAAEVGLWIHSSLASRGLGTRVLTALVEWGFTAWPWRRLVWRCDALNFASTRVAEKAGFQHEGTLRQHRFGPSNQLRDTQCYALLRPDWEKRLGRQS